MSGDISTSISVGSETDTNTANVANETNNTIIVPNVVQPTVNNTANNVVNNTNNVVPSYVNETNSTDSDIPYTGVEDTIIYFLGAAIILAIVFYIKFESVNK